MNNQDYQILCQILSKYPYTFYAYGSRVKGTARKFSDLDICFQENISTDNLCQIAEDLENSDLPFVVELVDWKDMRPVFKEMIRKDLTPITG